MGNLYQIPSAGEKVDEVLSREVEAVRDKLKVTYDTHEVITAPLLPSGYAPFVFPNGRMQLAADGVSDFRETFEATGCDPIHLLVFYGAVSHALNKRRKNSNDTFHDSLLEITSQARQHLPKIDELAAVTNDVHTAEDVVIGYIAARSAKLRGTARAGGTKTEQNVRVVNMMGSANKTARERYMTGNGEAYTVMSYFGLSWPRFDKLFMNLLKPSR